MPPDRSARPLASLSGLLVAEAGADELVGVVISIGSPGDGADIWMVGVRIGTVLAPIDSSGRSMTSRFLGALSVIVAIWSGSGYENQHWNVRYETRRGTEVWADLGLGTSDRARPRTCCVDSGASMRPPLVECKPTSLLLAKLTNRLRSGRGEEP